MISPLRVRDHDLMLGPYFLEGWSAFSLIASVIALSMSFLRVGDV